MEPLSETAAPVRAEIGEDIPSTGTAQVGGRTKRRVNTGFASGAASDGLLQPGAAGTLECADGDTGDHGAAGHTDMDSERAAACGETKEGSGWWKQPREAEGRAVKTGQSRCPHNRERSLCKECGGGSICEHKRQRSACKECGGGSICEHKRQRSACKECGGGSICEHNRIRSQCKACQADKDDSMPPDLEEL